MFFQKKNERAMNWLKEQNEKELHKLGNETPYSPEEDRKDLTEAEHTGGIPKEMQEAGSRKEDRKPGRKKKGMDIEKHDMTALTLAAFLVFMPVAILILGLFALVSWLFF